MKISDLLSMSVKNLTRRKFRTIMTIVGVVIGTAAIITMISIGIGVNQSTVDFISQMGDLTTIDVWQNAPDVYLDDETVAQIQNIEGVAAVTPFESPQFSAQLATGRNGRYTADSWNLTGVYPEALSALGFNVVEGKEISANPRRIEVVMGAQAAYNFQDTKRKGEDSHVWPYPDDITGEIPEPFVNLMTNGEMQLIVQVDEEKTLTYDLEVVGVLESGDESNYQMRNNFFVDIRELNRIFEDYKKATKSRDRSNVHYNTVKVKVQNIEDVGDVADQIRELKFYPYSPEDQRQEAMKQTQMMQLILGGLGGISLFVAAISIANTMVMSVYERTHEIGIMKVLGCFVSDIRASFLVEASIIGFVGGIIGILLSYLLSFLLNNFGMIIGEAMGMINFNDTGKVSIIPLWLVLLGLSFATGVGIVSGIYPAYRAVKISALEAIKQE